MRSVRLEQLEYTLVKGENRVTEMTYKLRQHFGVGFEIVIVVAGIISGSLVYL